MTTPTPSSDPCWSRLDQQLLDVLEIETLLPILCQALQLPPTTSAAANRALLQALIADPSMASAIASLRRNDPIPLRHILQEHYPEQLTPPCLHHLALLHWYQEEDAQRIAGLHGLFWLWEHHREYLQSIASAAVISFSIGEMPLWIIQDEQQALLPLGTRHRLDASTTAALHRLRELQQRIANDPLPQSQHFLKTILDGCAEQAAQQAILRAQTDLQNVEAACLRNDFSSILHLFRATDSLVAAIGHHEAISMWILEKVLALSWELYRKDHHKPLKILLEHALPYLDDLETRLQHGEAFGHQATFADCMVLLAETTKDEAKCQKILRRALKACPAHRNTSLCLASSNLRLASTQMATLLLSPHKTSQQTFRDIEALILEAQTLRPEHKRIPELQQDLEKQRKRLKL